MNDVNLDEASPVWPQLPGPLRLLHNRLSISFGGAELRYNRSPSTGPFLVRHGNVSAWVVIQLVNDCVREIVAVTEETGDL